LPVFFRSDSCEFAVGSCPTPISVFADSSIPDPKLH
jgi:hypothetical protein